MKRFYSFLFFLLAFGLGLHTVFGQGSTTSTINGRVLDKDGNPLASATVLVVHTPTGSRYGGLSNEDGYFRIANMQVGGPYELKVTYVGYAENLKNNIFLSLGQTYRVDVNMKEEETTLEEVLIISSTSDLFDGNRTGAETNVSEDAISKMPSSSRRLNDFLRLTPQAAVGNDGAVNSGAISFSGINNRFNSIFIDGAVNNDVFGLANSGTNGGQAGISPISPDALEQIQIVLAPYDVTLGGFAGGGVNAVTRSGTNTFSGSAYYFLRNQALAGKAPTENEAARTKLADFSAHTAGFRIGGPLIKDKLFFFTNVEIERREEPRPFIASDYIGEATTADLDAIRQKVINDFGYDPGGYENNPQTTDGEKIFAKLDWNINDDHKLSIRHSYVKGETEIHNSPSNTSVLYANTGYIFPSTTNSSAIELKSTFGSNISNNLIVGATIVRDDRDILGDPFPRVQLSDGLALIEFGTDNFSYSNIVFQDVYTLTNNLNINKGKHYFTIGTHNEFFKIQNLFSIFSTPRYSYFFDGFNRFMNDENPDLVLFGHEQLSPGQTEIRLGDEAENLGPTFNALQMAFYAQDEFQVSSNFKLTYGLRFDIPIFLEDPPIENTDFNNTTVPILEQHYDLKGARAANTPNTQILLSPRVGFNWDVKGDQTMQLRGGAGIFTSRVPWVWPGGMYIRNGRNSAFNVGAGVGQQPILGDPEQWKSQLFSSASPTGDVDLFTEKFKYPQIARASVALDQKLPWGMTGTVELMFTKTLNNIDVKHININPTLNTKGSDGRVIVDFSQPLDPTYTNITLVDNTSEGYTFNFSAQLQKAFENGFTGSLAYSFTRADALFDGAGFINNTNWQNILSTAGNNNPMVGRSIYDAGSRITSFLSYKADYANVLATTISIFYTGRSGSPYSYVYANTISDVSQSLSISDLVYVPASQSEINLVDIDGGLTAAAQWDQLDAFIRADDYLSSRRGDFVEQNKARTPFEHVIDLKIAQDFYVRTKDGMKHNLQVSLDIFNFTNMLNNDWGRRYFVGENTFPLIGSQRDPDTNELQFTFTDPGTTYSVVQSGTYSARWNAQFGVRYSF